MRCLITGATGFIGYHLTRYLLQQQCEIAVVIRKESSNLNRISDIKDQVHIIEGDLFNIDNAISSIENFKPEVVFHLAWTGVGGQYRNNDNQIIQNVNGSLKLLQVSAKSGCKKWIGLGSQAEYGSTKNMLTEELQANPETSYGVAKYCLGLLSKNLCKTYGIDFSWLRLIASYGPLDDANHMIPTLINTLLDGKKPALTKGEQIWDYLYVDDVVKAIWLAGIKPEAQGIYVLGSGQTYKIKYVVETIRDIINPNLPLGFGETPYRSDQVMYLHGDITRLKLSTGWNPEISLEEGLKKTINWHLTNQNNILSSIKADVNKK